METTPDLTNLMEWNRFSEERKTVIETLTILNNRHREVVAELNQRLIERQESFQAQLVRIEDTWREKLRDVEVYRDKYHNGCERLSAALSRIDYAVGEPNEKEVSTFDVDCNEERVVEVMRGKIAEFASKLSQALNLACKSDEDYDSEVDAKLWKELNDYQKAMTSARQ